MVEDEGLDCEGCLYIERGPLSLESDWLIKTDVLELVMGRGNMLRLVG